MRGWTESRLTQEEARLLGICNRTFGRCIDQCPPERWSVRWLVSFTYNLGGGALQRSTLRRKINREEHGEVPEQFMRRVWAGGRKLRGLVRSREAEALLYKTQQL